MLTGLPALESTDWSRLHHAYGRATDTPDHLLALLEGDTQARKEAVSHLWSAIIHQGTPWTATGAVALVVAGLLSDTRIDEGESIRPALLLFLVSVAEASGYDRQELENMADFDLAPFIDEENEEAFYENEEAMNASYAQSILSCIEATPVLMQVMLDDLNSPTPRVRACAAMGAGTLAKIESLKPYAPEIEARLLHLANTTQNTDERSAHVMALGELGYSPTAFLEDTSLKVRMCAALAPTLGTNEVAIQVLLDTLRDHAGEIDDWFEEKPPQFSMRPRFSVVARLVKQVKELDRLVDAAIAIVRITSKFCADFDWGPLLAAAFPAGDGVIKTEAQRRFLEALTENSELWDSTFGNAHKWFKQAGLPYERDDCRELIATYSDIHG